MHSCVNVVISGLPLSRPTCILRMHPLQATLSNIHIALSAATGLPCHAVRLFCDGRAAPQFPMSAQHQQQQQQSRQQQHTLFLTASVARALPGGKGGFGAMLRSTASSSVKKTSNFDACRDLHGRRLRDVHAARALASAAAAEKATAANAKRVQLQHVAGACTDANMTETSEQKVDRQDEQEQLDTETLVHAMDKTAADTRIALEKARMRRKAARSQKRTGSGKRRRHVDVVEVMQSAQPQHHQLQQVQSPPQHTSPTHVNDLEPLRKSHHSSPKRRRISAESHTRAHVPH